MRTMMMMMMMTMTMTTMMMMMRTLPHSLTSVRSLTMNNLLWYITCPPCIDAAITIIIITIKIIITIIITIIIITIIIMKTTTNYNIITIQLHSFLERFHVVSKSVKFCFQAVLLRRKNRRTETGADVRRWHVAPGIRPRMYTACRINEDNNAPSVLPTSSSLLCKLNTWHVGLADNVMLSNGLSQ